MSPAAVLRGAAGTILEAVMTKTFSSATTLWLTGLSGAGKSTLADAVAARWRAVNHPVVVLDGDEVRRGVCRDLGFSHAERSENIRRVAEMCKLLNSQGVAVIASLISPYAADRQIAREIVGTASLREIFLCTPLAVCESRDPKGLYRMARAGKIRNFTGIDSGYEPPEAPDLAIDMSTLSVHDAVERVLAMLRERA